MSEREYSCPASQEINFYCNASYELLYSRRWYLESVFLPWLIKGLEIIKTLKEIDESDSVLIADYQRGYEFINDFLFGDK